VAVFELAILRVEAPAADIRALGNDDALRAGRRYFNLGGDGGGVVLAVSDAACRKPAHAPGQRLSRPAVGPWSTREPGIDLLGNSVVDRQHVIASRLDQPQSLQLAQLIRHLLGEVPGLTPVLAGVVELPDVIVERYRLPAHKYPGRAVLRHRGPALVVD